MSLTRALITRNLVIAAKLETTTGTAVSLANSDCGFMAEAPDMQEEASATETPLPGFMGAAYFNPGAMSGRLKFKTKLYGSGSDTTGGTLISVLLAGCGLIAATGVYYVSSQPVQTLTMATYQDGQFMSICGAMGTAVFNFKAGEPCEIDWDFMGAWVDPSEVAIPSSITFPATQPPRFAGNTFTLGGTAYNVETVKIDLGMDVKMRPSPAGANGYLAAGIFGRKPSWSCDPESLSLSTQNWFAAFKSKTSVAGSLVVGSASDNKFTFAMPFGQLMKPPARASRNGIIVDKLDFSCNDSVGDDGLSVTPA